MVTVLSRTSKEILYGVSEQSYDVLDWIINPDFTAVANVDPRYWKITDNTITEMSTAEKATVDAADIAGIKEKKITFLSKNVRDYVFTHYAPERQTSLLLLLQEASIFGYVNRMAYIFTGANWIKNTIGFYYTKRDEIISKTTISDVNAVVWDLPATFDASDPNMTLEQASGTWELPIINSTLTASATVNQTFTYSITSLPFPRLPTSYNATSLPAGLTVNNTTGVISGTPTESGSFNVTISATNSAGTDTKTLALTVNA